MNTQDMDRLVSEYHAYIQNAERYGADQAFKAEALNYQWAAEICSRLVERTTGAEAQEWLKKLAACEKKTRKLWTELYTRVRKSEPETGSAEKPPLSVSRYWLSVLCSWNVVVLLSGV